MDKKTGAIGLKPIVYLIIFIISALLITTLYLSLGDVGKEVQEGLACHLMLGGRDATDLGPANIIIPQVQANCRTISKTLPENSKNLYDLQLELANTIANTMWIIHHGNVKDSWGKSFWEKDQCFIMYTISFEESRRIDDISISTKDFFYFLRANFYTTIDDVPYTYMDYIINHPKSEQTKISLLIDEGMDFNFENSYAISIISGQAENALKNIASKSVSWWMATPFAIPATAIKAGTAVYDEYVKAGEDFVTTIMFSTLNEAIKGGCYTR